VVLAYTLNVHTTRIFLESQFRY